MEGDAPGWQGLIWSLTIVVMPILLGLAIAYGAWQTWKRRRDGAPVRREPGRIDNVHAPDPEGQARYIGKLGLISAGVFVIAALVIVAVFFL